MYKPSTSTVKVSVFPLGIVPPVILEEKEYPSPFSKTTVQGSPVSSSAGVLESVVPAEGFLSSPPQATAPAKAKANERESNNVIKCFFIKNSVNNNLLMVVLGIPIACEKNRSQGIIPLILHTSFIIQYNEKNDKRKRGVFAIFITFSQKKGCGLALEILTLLY